MSYSQSTTQSPAVLNKENGAEKVGFKYGENVLSYLSIRESFSDYFAAFCEKVARDSGTIKITCRGDSLTYGEDNVVSQREADPAATPEGRTHTSLRANETYPEALQRFLRQVFSATVNVVNQGYSGDNTDDSFLDWTTNENADVCFIMLGTNDAAEGFSPYQSLEQYAEKYRRIILREFSRETAVVLITSPEQKQVNGNTRLLEAYRQKVFALGNEFGVPVIDGWEIFRNSDSVVWADNVHFKTAGYQLLAAKVAAFVMGRGNNYQTVYSGSNLTTRLGENSIKAKLSNWGIQTAKGGQNTPPLSSFSGGYVTETSNYGEYIVFYFYAAIDDLIVTPNVNVENARLNIALDFGADAQPQYTFDDKVWEDTDPDRTAKPAHTTTINAFDSEVFIDNLTEYATIKDVRIHIASKGWHSIRFDISNNGSTTGTPRLTVGGLSFLDYSTQRLVDRKNLNISGNQTPVGNVTPEYLGQEYLDTSPGVGEWFKAVGLTSANWKKINYKVEDYNQSDTQSPIGNVTPRFLGDEYLDTSSGQYHWYKATGLTSNDWKQTTN
ncbi:tail fiber protein [Vibrio phage D526]